MKSTVIIGYSGHAYVVLDIFKSQARSVIAYCDNKALEANPFSLAYWGSENEASVLEQLKAVDWFVAIGNNIIRKKVSQQLNKQGLHEATKAIHAQSVIGAQVKIGAGTMIAANVSINALAEIGDGVICNTGSIIEHECKIGNFAHIAPGAVLAGNVRIGAGTFLGANSVVKQGVTIGKNVTIGAGTVVIKDVPDHLTLVGNPQRIIKR